jgi:hypothetical protein
MAEAPESQQFLTCPVPDCNKIASETKCAFRQEMKFKTGVHFAYRLGEGCGSEVRQPNPGPSF